MASSSYHQVSSSAPIHPELNDNIRPIAPVRGDLQYNHQDESLLPQPPPRRDIPSQNNPTTSHQADCSCNYNRYATKKTIGHGLLEFALISSNAMQLRTLILQKQRDGIWIASLILVCVSILAQLGLAYLLIIIGKGDIQNPQKQIKLEKYNNTVLFITMLVSMINVIINAFMLSANSNSYLDASSIELLRNHT